MLVSISFYAKLYLSISLYNLLILGGINMSTRKKILSLILATSMVLCNLSFNSLLPTLSQYQSNIKHIHAATTDDTKTDSYISASVVNANLEDNVYSNDYFSVLYSTVNLTKTTYQINDCKPVSFSNKIQLTIGMDTAYEEETKVLISGISTLDSSNVSKTFIYKRSKSPLDTNNSLSCIVTKISDFETSPYIYLYTLNSDGADIPISGRWPGTCMEQDGDYFYYYLNNPVTEDIFVCIYTYDSNGRYQYPDADANNNFTHVSISQNVLFDRTTEEFIPLSGSSVIGITYGTVSIQYRTQNNQLLKEITRVGKIGDSYTAYAPEYLSDCDDYVLTSSNYSKSGTFKRTKSTITFYYNKKTDATSTPTASPTATPTKSPTSTPTATPTETPTETSTSKPLETSVAGTPTVGTSGTPTNETLETPAIETPITSSPTTETWETPTSITQTPYVTPTITPTTEPTTTPEPTAYIPLSQEGSSHIVT